MYVRWLVGKDDIGKEAHRRLHCFHWLLRHPMYHWSSKCGLCISSSASPRNLLDMQTSGQTPDLLNQQLCAWVQDSILTSLPGELMHAWIWESRSNTPRLVWVILKGLSSFVWMRVKSYGSRDHLKDGFAFYCYTEQYLKDWVICVSLLP